jgi:hypothetical protein
MPVHVSARLGRRYTPRLRRDSGQMGRDSKRAIILEDEPLEETEELIESVRQAFIHSLDKG